MNSHDHVGDIAKDAATQAAVKFDLQVFSLLKDNGLEDLFTDAINGLDRDALKKRGYMLIVEGGSPEHYQITLVKVIDSTKFKLGVEVGITEMKMKES